MKPAAALTKDDDPPAPDGDDGVSSGDERAQPADGGVVRDDRDETAETDDDRQSGPTGGIARGWSVRWGDDEEGDEAHGEETEGEAETEEGFERGEGIVVVSV